jgi:hypothetical protein
MAYDFSMSTVAEIEAAISNLPPQDFAQVRDWLLERDNLLWDKQIEEDAAAGRLDHIIEEIEGDIADGRIKPLNEVINGS